jgi:hypothetical protein
MALTSRVRPEPFIAVRGRFAGVALKPAAAR